MALTSNLVSYWKLDESSTGAGAVTRNDSVGSNHLTDNNATPSDTGIISNAASFTAANSESLSIVSASQSPDLSLSGASGDIFISAWVRLTSKPAAEMWVASKYSFSNGLREYGLYWDNTVDRFKFVIWDATTNSNTVTASTFGAPSTATWYFLMAWVDNTANTVNISVNDGAVDSTALTVTTHNGTAPFQIGCVGNIGAPISYWDGRIDEVGVWSTAPSSTDRTLLYNGGAGFSYPFSSSSDVGVSWYI